MRRLSSTIVAMVSTVGVVLMVSGLAGSSAAAPAPLQTLMPGVTFEQQVELTPHGPVTYSVIDAPPPTGLYSLGPVLSGGTISGGRETVTQIEQSVSTVSTVAGIDGDFFNASNSTPDGIVMAGGQLEHGPTPSRASIGFDTNGGIHVGRIAFTGTWQGTGPRRPLAGVNQKPKANQTVLFTPAWGPSTPDLPPSTALTVLEPLTANINTDLTATVTATGTGSTPIPADGAVLVATGTEAAKLQAETSQGATATVRLTLPDSWVTVVSALGGGPLLVKDGKPIFSTGENFASRDLTRRDARAAVGQLADGRVVLVAVDSGRPGYSVGMTTYELAETMVKLGAVTAAGLEFGKFVTAAFDGRLLNRPSDPSGQRPVKEALLVQYQGVYLPPLPTPLLGKDDAAAGEQLSYRLVRPSTVTASVIGPDGVSHVVDSGSKQPGQYTFGWTSFNVEGTWHWNVQATDDLGRQSTGDETFQYDLTLTGLSVPKVVSASAGLDASFVLSRPATVMLQIAAANGTAVNTLPAVQLTAGAQTVSWDGMTSAGVPAPRGAYVAEVTETSSLGTASYSAPFALRK